MASAGSRFHQLPGPSHGTPTITLHSVLKPRTILARGEVVFLESLELVEQPWTFKPFSRRTSVYSIPNSTPICGIAGFSAYKLKSDNLQFWPAIRVSSLCSHVVADSSCCIVYLIPHSTCQIRSDPQLCHDPSASLKVAAQECINHQFRGWPTGASRHPLNLSTLCRCLLHRRRIQPPVATEFALSAFPIPRHGGLLHAMTKNLPVFLLLRLERTVA